MFFWCCNFIVNRRGECYNVDLKAIDANGGNIYESKEFDNGTELEEYEYEEDEKDNKWKIGKKEKGKYSYVLSRDVFIEANLDYINNKNHDNFNIDKWISVDNKSGKIQFSHANVVSLPFSVGRRDCVGKLFAIRQLYIFLANFILHYQFIASNGQPDKMEIEFKDELIKTVEPQIGVKVERRKLQ